MVEEKWEVLKRDCIAAPFLVYRDAARTTAGWARDRRLAYRRDARLR
jgi:hypothetical protein